MKAKKILILCIGMLMLTVSGCGEKVNTETEEKYTPVDYNIFPIPENAYVGDTMPFVTEDGTLELYYLYETDNNGAGYHPVYKLTTDNLYSYKDCGKMLDFGTAKDADLAIGTGSVIQDQDGLYHLFYTGHNDMGNGGKGKECVMHATSTDRENWVKIPEDTFYSPDNYSKDDFRDPEVFWVEEKQEYWLLIAAREDQMGGVIAKYTSNDLHHWDFCGPIYAPYNQYMLECPDLFQMGDKYYLTYSWDCVTYYAIGDSIDGPFYAPTDNVLDGNGFIFYAAKTTEFKGKRYLCGWLGRSALGTDAGLYQWAGNVLNHELVQLPDGKLGVRAPEILSEYFEDKVEMDAAKTPIELEGEAGTELVDLGMRMPTMTLECDVEMAADAFAGFVFGGQEGKGYTALCLDGPRKLIHYEGIETTELDDYDPVAFTAFDFSKKEKHHVKLVCENEIVVIYVDDEKALSSRIYRSTNGAHFGVFVKDSQATFSNIQVCIPHEG